LLDITLPGASSTDPARHYGSAIGLWCLTRTEELKHEAIADAVFHLVIKGSPGSSETPIYLASEKAASVDSGFAAIAVPHTGTVAPGATMYDTLHVDATGPLVVAAICAGAPATLSLVTPTGQRISAADTSSAMEYVSDLTTGLQA